MTSSLLAISGGPKGRAVRPGRELDRLSALRRALAIYRMVFGQSRQEDLISYLLAQIPNEKLEMIVKELTIDLSPTTPAKSAAES